MKSPPQASSAKTDESEFKKEQRLFAVKKHSEWSRNRSRTPRIKSLEDLLERNERFRNEKLKEIEYRKKDFLKKLELPNPKGPNPIPKQMLSKQRREALLGLIRMDPANLGQPLVQAHIIYFQRIVCDTPNKEYREKAVTNLLRIGEALVPKEPLAERRKKTWFPAYHPTYLWTYFEELFCWQEVKRMKGNKESPEYIAEYVEEEASIIKKFWGAPESSRLAEEPALIAVQRMCDKTGLTRLWAGQNAKPPNPGTLLNALRKK